MFVSLVENSGDFIAIASLVGRVLYMNASGRDLIEVGSLDDARGLGIEDLFLAPDLAYVRNVILPAVRSDGRWRGNFRFRNVRTGEAVAVDFHVFYIRQATTGEPVALATVSQDIAERRLSEQRLRTLVDAGAALTSSLDYAQTFKNLAELVVRSLATFCVIVTSSEQASGASGIERVAAFHADPAKRPVVERLARIFAPSVDGSSSLVSRVDAEWLRGGCGSAECADVFRTLGVRSLLTVPLEAGGRVLGALTCGLSEEDPPREHWPRRYDSADLFFVEELGRRAGAAIVNAQLYERERRIAVSLQAASLPRTLPTFEGVQFDAEYRPGNAEATIGGDWYDAFVIEDGRVVVTVGDVFGNGLQAAIAMTKLRQAMQSAAMVDPEPNVMLDVADKTLRIHDPDGYATAVAAIYDPIAQSVTFASAGHPGPALRTGDGRVEEFISPGLLLGLRTGADLATITIDIPDDSMLVFFTDGLIEATHDIDQGHARLHTALSRPQIAYSDSPARAIVEAVFDGNPGNDDVAVLSVRFAPASHG